MKPFDGFPEGRLRATVLPSLFFTEALGVIDDLLELKLVLYMFWRIAEKKMYPRFLSRSELEADPLIGHDLRSPSTLSASLDKLVAHKLVLRRTMELGGRSDDYFFLNTSNGRRSIDDLESRRIDVGQIVKPPEPDARISRPDIFSLYEENIGILSPIIVEELSEAERRYPADWIEDAVRQAVLYNRRRWRYVQGILDRWESEGKSSETDRRRDSSGSASTAYRGGIRTRRQPT